ncbi:MAG: hypothetical protein JWQ54_2203 [Mucilaginibacter sp.]|nr:hypothetical protein [Mucilaginibacter sp.]
MMGETGNIVYVFHTPTDVQYDPSNEKLKADYESMFKDIKTIKATFEIKNYTLKYLLQVQSYNQFLLEYPCVSHILSVLLIL